MDIRRILGCAAFSLLVAMNANGQSLPTLVPENLNFIVVNDMGANKPEVQKPVADVMEAIVSSQNIDFIIVAGDPIHGEGVQSADDPVWDRRFKNVYSAPCLQEIPWYPVCGNHEYRGNPQAVLDYAKVDPKWKMPSLYYTMEMGFENSDKTVRFVMLDTAPMVRIDKSADPEATTRHMEEERAWLDSLLTADHSDWKFIIGHHPIYANTTKMASDLKEMRERVGDRIEAAGADFYIGGHIHNFQYIKPKHKKVNYIINASASVNRDSEDTDGTIWHGDGPGLSVFSIAPDKTDFYFMNSTGEVVYQNTVTKESK